MTVRPAFIHGEVLNVIVYSFHVRTGNKQWNGSPAVILTDKVVSLFTFCGRCRDTAVVIILSYYCMAQIVQAVSELSHATGCVYIRARLKC